MNEIKNAQVIESIFGCWPSFHDAEIHSILLGRSGELGPYMDVTIHHWQMTNQIDDAGCYVHKHHTLSTLRFSGVANLVLTGFNHQNVLWDIEITEIGDTDSRAKFDVAMPTSFGCETAFKCEAISVLSAVPYSKT